MSKLAFLKFFVLGLVIFVLGGCSVYPFASPSRMKGTTTPVVQAPEVTPVATTTDRVASSTKVRVLPNVIYSSQTPWNTYSGKCGLSFKYPPYLYDPELPLNDSVDGCNFIAAIGLQTKDGSFDSPIISILHNPGIKTMTDAEALASVNDRQSYCQYEKLGVKEVKLASVNVYYSICENPQDPIGTLIYYGHIISRKSQRMTIFSIMIPTSTPVTVADMDKVIAGFEIK